MDQLKTMMGSNTIVSLWSDTDIEPGEKWRTEIQSAIDSAAVAILLVSPDFLDSKFITEYELPRILMRAQSEGLTVFWVHVRTAMFEETPIVEFQAAHDAGHALVKLSAAQRGLVLKEICQKLLGVVRKARVAAKSRGAASSESRSAPTLCSDHDLSGLDAKAEAACQTLYLTKFWRDHPDANSNDGLASLRQGYSTIFHLVAKSDGLSIRASQDLFEQVIAYISAEDSGEYPLHVTGDAGSGKSTFLAIVYFQLLQNYRRNPRNPYPIYLNLQTYVAKVYDNRGGRDLADLALERYLADVAPIRECISFAQDRCFVVIIDGLCTRSTIVDRVALGVDELLRNTKHKKVLGQRPVDGKAGRPILTTSGWPRATLDFGSIGIEDPSARAFVAAWASVAGCPVEPDIVLKMARKFELTELDVFTVSRLGRDGTKGSRSFSDVMESFCVSSLHTPKDKTVEEAMGEVSKLAFARVIRKRELSYDELSDNPYWELAHEHPMVQSYLVAHHVVHAFEQLALGRSLDDDELRFVYPHQINRFCKELIRTRSAAVQKAVSSRMRELLRRPHSSVEEVRKKTHAAYLLGRMKTTVESRDALAELEAQLERESQSGMDRDGSLAYDRAWRLLERTVAISTINITTGEDGKRARAKYIRRLLRDKRWELVNRGFHLEYYGDVDYDPETAFENEDTLCECPRTFGTLARRIELGPGKRSLYELEVFTYASLAQHRHAAGLLSRERRLEVAATLKRVVALKVLGRETQNHAEMVLEHLQLDGFTVGRLAEELLLLKAVKRAGWVVRGMLECESVADHTVGAVLLALLYLPNALDCGDKDEKRRYDKNEIISMLLFHDVPEAYTGDRLPHEKHDLERQEERDRAGYLQALSSYSDVGGFGEIAGLWEEVETPQTINGRIAKDFDALENLAQLYFYRRTGQVIEDFADWRDSLLDRLKTSEGRRVALILERHFDPDEHAAWEPSGLPRRPSWT